MKNTKQQSLRPYTPPKLSSYGNVSKLTLELRYKMAGNGNNGSVS